MGMPKESRARAPLKKAHYYAALASDAAKADRAAFHDHVETAIVHARAVTHHLIGEYKNCAGFKEWFNTLWENRLHSFLVRQRNYILKERPAKVHKKGFVSTEGKITPSGSLECKVIRAQPWYRRSPSILWQDFLRPIKQAIKRLADRWTSIREAAKRRREAAKRHEPVVSVNFYFDEEGWRDRPALELLEEYLGWLEGIVQEAENRFGGRTPEACQKS